jgi:hypothetical protein
MKVRNVLILYLLILISVWFLPNAGAQDAYINGFSADVITHSGDAKGSSGVMRGKIYFAKDKMRMENTVETNGHSMTSISIIRIDKNVMWMLMPQQNMYMEMPVKPQEAVRAEAISKNPMDEKPVGSEMIDGQMVDKYDISNGRCTGYKYISSVSHFLLKIEMDCGNSHTVTEYKNIQKGESPDELFEIPAGYKKFSLGNVSDIIKMGKEMGDNGQQTR